jgi:hypothetical protein
MTKRFSERRAVGYVTLSNGQRLAIHDPRIAGVMRWYADRIAEVEAAWPEERARRMKLQSHWWVRLGWRLGLCRPNLPPDSAATKAMAARQASAAASEQPSTNGESHYRAGSTHGKSVPP